MSRIQVRVDGRTLALSNLDKPMYPDLTKGEVIDYYTRIAPVLLPHLRDRALTRVRFPEGVGALRFYEKNAPRGTPEWVRTARVETPEGQQEAVDFVVADDLPTLVWCVNLAALELHVPQWRVSTGEVDLMVFDLDPGAPAAFTEACVVGLLLRELLAADGLAAYPKSSGRKGLHLYVPVAGLKDFDTSEYAKRAAERLEADYGRLVTSRMERRLRTGKVFVDWSQNTRYKTTIAPYSLRALDTPSVSTPLTWDEVEAGRSVRFGPGQVLERVREHGDLLAPLLD